MTANRLLNGSISVSTIYKGQLVKEIYFGYRISTARKLFRKKLKSLEVPNNGG